MTPKKGPGESNRALFQAQVNAHFSGCPTSEHPMRGAKLFSPMASADTLLAGLMTVTDIEERAPGFRV